MIVSLEYSVVISITNRCCDPSTLICVMVPSRNPRILRFMHHRIVSKENATQHEELGFKISMRDTLLMAMVLLPTLEWLPSKKEAKKNGNTTSKIKSTMTSIHRYRSPNSAHEQIEKDPALFRVVQQPRYWLADAKMIDVSVESR